MVAMLVSLALLNSPAISIWTMVTVPYLPSVEVRPPSLALPSNSVLCASSAPFFLTLPTFHLASWPTSPPSSASPI